MGLGMARWRRRWPLSGPLSLHYRSTNPPKAGLGGKRARKLEEQALGHETLVSCETGGAAAGAIELALKHSYHIPGYGTALRYYEYILQSQKVATLDSRHG